MIPLMIGTVGGAISALPMAKLSLKLLRVNNVNELSRIIVSVGLAQNFAALKALVTEGIQKGHMNLHLDVLAIHAGAKGQEIEVLANKLRQLKEVNLSVAQRLLEEIRAEY